MVARIDKPLTVRAAAAGEQATGPPICKRFLKEAVAALLCPGGFMLARPPMQDAIVRNIIVRSGDESAARLV